jgi:hypothetical protein
MGLRTRCIKATRAAALILAAHGLSGTASAGTAGSTQEADAVTAIDVRSFGAKGDGQTVDTASLQAAIDSAAKAGGGVVSLASGQYVSGTLLLKSHVTLRIETGATLLGSTAPEDYHNLATAGQPLPVSQYNQDETRFEGLLIALDQDDIAVTGGGTIDGRGATVAANIHQLQLDHRLPGNPASRPDESLRPCLINFVRCHHVHMADITLRDSACWVEDYSGCDDLTLDQVVVRSQAFWNNDGIDISGCQHVRLSGCDIDSADDGICLKSNSTPCEDIVIHDCRVRSWANAIKFGTVSFVGFRHISISNCQVWGCGHAGLAIESVDSAIVEDVNVSDLTMTNLRQAILVKLGSRHTPDGHVGAIRNVTLSDITADLADGNPDAGQKFKAPQPGYKHNRFPCIVSGLPGHPIENLTMRRITYHTTGGGTPAVANVPLDKLASIPENSRGYPEYSMHGELPAFGLFIRHAVNLTLDNSSVDCARVDSRAGIVCDDVSHLNITGLRVTNAGGTSPVVVLNNVHDADVQGGTAAAASKLFVQLLHDCSGVTTTQNTLN